MVEVFRIGAKPKKPNEPLTPEEIGEIVFNSDNELVKRLINNYEAKEKKIDRYEKELDQQKSKIEKMERVIRHFQNAQNALIDFKL